MFFVSFYQASLPHEEQQGKVVSVLTQLLRQQQLAAALTVEHKRREVLLQF